MTNTIGTATYSPDDNKIRLYPDTRLEPEIYERVKAAGYKWAPKQGFFVAPMWTPSRADLATELCGDLGDEDKSLTERSEERAERFEDYSDKRANDAEQARKAVSAIANNIPFGQPILIGHHSEKHARKDAAKIENGMRKAVKMWETSEYWTQRAAGAIAHAKYKERADVRARRIKTLEASKRKQEKSRAEYAKWLKLWDVEGLTLENARAIANYCGLIVTRKNADGTPYHTACSGWSAYNVLQPDGDRYAACPSKTVEECQDAARFAYPRHISWCDRWITHYENRLAYERAMLGEQGGTVAEKIGPVKGGGVKCWASPRGGWAYIQKVNKVSVTVLDNWGNGGGNFTRTIPFDKLAQIVTPEYIAEKRAAGQIKDTPCGCGFYIMESREQFDAREEAAGTPNIPDAEPNKAEVFAAMKDTLKAGVQIVAAPQLFPTPRDLAERMADLLDVQPGQRVLEPSAGTGMLLGAIGCRNIGQGQEHAGLTHAIEINRTLSGKLQAEFPLTTVYCEDFLDFNPGEFDRIIMNPPFANADDIKHIKHAASMLSPGGRLVALCANGPRQREALQPIASYWEDLPTGAFAAAGTGVNVALLTIEG